MSFTAAVSQWRDRVDQTLGHYLESAEIARQLLDAMSYSTFNGGKRLRPVLVYAACEALGGNPAAADPVAAAVECIHAYSLIHDDLPAMDDDDLRRGKPTCHIAFDEATAILAGDALQTLAFEILSRPSDYIDPPRQMAIIRTLALASGDKGMVAGQMIDTVAAGSQLNLSALECMHGLKTGALIRASVRMGALASGIATEEQLLALDRYADAIGLAFQVQDDILDVEGDTQILGKQQGADIALDKPTYPSLLGMEVAKVKAAELHQAALSALSEFDDKAILLRQLADYVVERDH